MDCDDLQLIDHFVPFSSSQIKEEEIQEVISTLKSGWLSTGPKVVQFQQKFAQYKNTSHAFAVSSCTAALHLSLITANLQPNDEVITTPMTFCATVNAILYAGCIPVLADIDMDTMNISVQEIEKKITPRTKAIIPVHFGGRLCNMYDIMSLSERYQLIVVEDCAHAIETQVDDRSAGTFGHFGCFSFYATKNMTTGEGGMLLVNNSNLHERVRQLSLHGLSSNAWDRFQQSTFSPYLVKELGFKYNMTDIQASLGIYQLSRIRQNWESRRQIWEYYNQHLQGLPIILPAPVLSNEKHAYHLYTILLDESKVGMSRQKFIEKMYQANIGLSVHYTSIPEHPYYQKRFSWKPSDYPHSYQVSSQTVSLPLHLKLKDEELHYITNTIKKILG